MPLAFSKSVAVALIWASCAAPLVAQQAESERSIVVTGKHFSQDEARTVAQTYVRQIAAIPFGGQYARWHRPICPKALGLSDENARLVTAEIRRIAAEAGARVAKARCQPNLDVIFTDDGARQMQAIARRSGRMLFSISQSQLSILLNGPEPVRWWYVTRIEGKDSERVSAESAALSFAVIQGSPGGMGSVSDGNSEAMDAHGASLIGTGVRSTFDAVGVIVDVNQATGKPLDAVSAYVAMVALAQIRMDHVEAPTDSILSLFAYNKLPMTELSRVDHAFLYALYHTPANRDRKKQAAAMIRIMTERLAVE